MRYPEAKFAEYTAYARHVRGVDLRAARHILSRVQQLLPGTVFARHAEFMFRVYHNAVVLYSTPNLYTTVLMTFWDDLRYFLVEAANTKLPTIVEEE